MIWSLLPIPIGVVIPNIVALGVSGFVIKLAGGAVYYKTKFQTTIALSSTEAEFNAACDAGKAILYIRTILEEIGMEQKEASVLHIDNNGVLNMAN